MIERSIEALWERRSRSFWSESMPYIRYMMQSGVPGVAFLLLLTGLAGYASLLRELPEAFPVAAVGTAALTPLICWSPLRTWLREADIVFLMPREAEMARYLRRSFRYSLMSGVALALLVCLLYMPLYRHGHGQLPAALLPAAVLALKLANAAGAWQERRLVWNGMRSGIRLLRWAATAVAAAAWLHTSPWTAGLYTAVAAALFALLYRGLVRHRLPWLRLIEEETRTRRRFGVFFSMFTDVPAETAHIASRRYLSWLAGRIGYGRQSAFVYLYAHTLIRTELGGIILRLAVLGMLAVLLAAQSALLAGFGAALVYLLFVWIGGIQLSSLAHAHRHSVWRHVYPLPETSRLGALAKVDRTALLAFAALVWLPNAALLPAGGFGSIWPPLAAGGMAAMYILLLRPGRMRRAAAAELED